MEMIQEMQEVIRKNLPEATARELKKYLEEAETARKLLAEKILTCTEQGNSIAKLSGTVVDLQRVILELKERTITEGALDKKEKDINAKRNDLTVEIASLRVVEAEKRADSIYKLAEIVFKNPAYTRQTIRSGSETVSPSYPGSGESRSRNDNETITNRIE